MSDLAVAAIALACAVPAWLAIPPWLRLTRRVLRTTGQSFFLSDHAEAVAVVILRGAVALIALLAVVNLVRLLA